jgi:hypothetical protein
MSKPWVYTSSYTYHEEKASFEMLQKYYAHAPISKENLKTMGSIVDTWHTKIFKPWQGQSDGCNEHVQNGNST